MFNSSYNEDSRIYRLTDYITNVLKEDLHVNYRTPFNTSMFPHNGNTEYYETGVHLQDKQDDINLVKKEILDSDLIVLATPVYCHMASSAMVVFIERVFSNWVHLFRILGKPYIIITTSESNGNNKAYSYIDNNLEIAGGMSLGHFPFKNIDTDEKERLEDLIKVAKDVIDQGSSISITDKQESAFQTYKYVLGQYDFENYERKYWESNKLMQADSLNDFWELYKNRGKIFND